MIRIEDRPAVNLAAAQKRAVGYGHNVVVGFCPEGVYLGRRTSVELREKTMKELPTGRKVEVELVTNTFFVAVLRTAPDFDVLFAK